MLKKDKFLSFLKECFVEPKCELNFSNTFELLIAVILSAQCTDKRVNLVTSYLFEKLKNPQDFVNISTKELEELIKSCGLYHSKAKHIKDACDSIVNNFGGEVPKNYSDLLSLSGVGRKTANVVSSLAFGENRIAVDTHVLRVSNRLGFSKSSNPNVVEKDLTKLFKKDLRDLHYRMVLFGRYYCKAINPTCDVCKLKDQCLYYKNKHKNLWLIRIIIQKK